MFNVLKATDTEMSVHFLPLLVASAPFRICLLWRSACRISTGIVATDLSKGLALGLCRTKFSYWTVFSIFTGFLFAELVSRRLFHELSFSELVFGIFTWIFLLNWRSDLCKAFLLLSCARNVCTGFLLLN